MTTYTLNTSFSFYESTVSYDIVGVDGPGIPLELVVNDDVTTLTYSVNPLEPGDEPGDETVEIDLDLYDTRLDGISDDDLDVVASMLQITWPDENDITRSTTILVLEIDDYITPGQVSVEADFVFYLSGDALPTIDSIAGFNAFEDSITNFAIPTGAYGPGVDILLTSLGDTTISQNDVIEGTEGNDDYDTGAGRDIVHGADGDDDLNGGVGNDTLYGDAGADSLFGGKGRDVLNGGTQGDLLNGGNGIDAASYLGATAGVTANLADITVNTGDAAGDRYIKIEDLTGSVHRDILYGNSSANTVDGRGGADRLFGRGRDDVLNGGGGNDRLDGGKGDDTLTGGANRDTFVFKLGDDVVTDFGDGNDRLKFDDALWSGVDLTPAEVLDFASVVNGDTVFDFGNGNTLTLENYTNIAALETDIIIF